MAVIFFQAYLIIFYCFMVPASSLVTLPLSPTSGVNSTSFGVDPPRNIVCSEDFGGLGENPDYNDCARAVSLLPRGAFA